MAADKAFQNISAQPPEGFTELWLLCLSHSLPHSWFPVMIWLFPLDESPFLNILNSVKIYMSQPEQNFPIKQLLTFNPT